MTTLIAGSDTLIRLNLGEVVMLTDIVELEIDYFTDDTNKVTLTKDKGIIIYDGYITAKLESADTVLFKGLLKCELRIGWNNNVFSDKAQNITLKQTLNLKYI